MELHLTSPGTTGGTELKVTIDRLLLYTEKGECWLMLSLSERQNEYKKRSNFDHCNKLPN